MSPAVQRRRVQALCEWFACNARDLPWRRKRTGYTALVAEFMLQQTQVSRVLDSYKSFLRLFPTVRTLAEADEQDVLSAWRGLGYYRRARNLHAAARMIVAEFHGRMPRSVAELKKLPGVGRYTAGAIASMVYHQPEPAVDGNVRRVLARWFADKHVADDTDAERRTWERAQELVNIASNPGMFNEAMMELGATVCTPKVPRCHACMVSQWCEAHRRGLQTSIPIPKKPAKQQHVHHHTVVIARGKKVLLQQRPENGLWSNMWQAPTIEAETALSLDDIRCALPIRVNALLCHYQFQHQTTHRRISFHVYRAKSRAHKGEWRTLDNIDDLPMSNPMRRILTVHCSDNVIQI